MKTIIAIAVIWAAAAHVAYADTATTAESSSASAPVGSRFAVQLGVFDDDLVALEWVSKLKTVGVPAYF
ncbi:SPOR domain-containing protein [Paraburkholderia sediminicola]|uniref:SPOR domain-containing protein n=1 Tax=Paraburkholderia sediminicola TaxID=458836 RepID=UPI0038B91294